MSEVTRRMFIKRSAAGVAGAAAIGVLATGPAAAATRLASHAPDEADAGESSSADAVVAYIRPGTREVRVMVGEREIVHRDAGLARRILRAAK